LDWSFRIGLTQDKKKKIGPGFGVQSGAVISFSIYFSLFSKRKRENLSFGIIVFFLAKHY